MVRGFWQCVAIALFTCTALNDLVLGEEGLRYRNTAIVCVHMDVTDYLPGPALATLQAEASRIWHRHGIKLVWTRETLAICETTVAVVVDDERFRKQARKRDTALALTVFKGRDRTIYVSVQRAFQMLTSLRVIGITLFDGGERDLRGGMLLGRVLAHELGHVLLNTTEHTETGLMRPVFATNDALGLGLDTTDLSRFDSSRIEMRFALVPLDAAAPPSVLARGTQPK